MARDEVPAQPTVQGCWHWLAAHACKHARSGRMRRAAWRTHSRRSGRRLMPLWSLPPSLLPGSNHLRGAWRRLTEPAGGSPSQAAIQKQPWAGAEPAPGNPPGPARPSAPHPKLASRSSTAASPSSSLTPSTQRIWLSAAAFRCCSVGPGPDSPSPVEKRLKLLLCSGIGRYSRASLPLLSCCSPALCGRLPAPMLLLLLGLLESTELPLLLLAAAAPAAAPLRLAEVPEVVATGRASASCACSVSCCSCCNMRSRSSWCGTGSAAPCCSLGGWLMGSLMDTRP
mmetsp:Transcript_9525/g.23588  ORF Transcript_9525/g.23588 Transcript_9525/m.23588 type:complete len:284 (-) Transcript_9525:796-1647(-)